ncbi:MAG: LysR family transcriptional regulator [Cohaesibacter sp.]|jgi:LysR family glycine cleavage system transcriptional activator|nr:LysR family transcriptional regulator [Cohaesibacter sp.]
MPVSPPRPKWPPLNALRAFEAAARLQSFSAAADELCVTPGAVAQHIKSLEALIGEKLFNRQAQGVELTALGQQALPAFIQAFDGLGQAVHSLRQNSTRREIRIAALPSLSQLWLSARMPLIRKALPDCTISITALETMPNMRREPFDLSLFFEEEPLSDNVIKLGQDSIFPVCAPQLANKLSHLQDLSDFPCLHDAIWSSDWKIWCESLNERDQLSMPLDIQGPTFSLFSLALEEAKNGAGLLMGHKALVQDCLDDGSLVKPFDREIPLPRHLVLALAPNLEDNQDIRKIIQCLTTQ